MPGGHAFEFHALVPVDAPPGSDWELRACVRGAIDACSEPFAVHIVRSLQWKLEPRANFPIRDDVSLQTWPPLWSISLPGSMQFKLSLKNPGSRPIEAKLAFEGEDLRFETEKNSILIEAGKESIVPVTVWPRPHLGSQQTSTGIYSFKILVQTSDGSTEIPARLVGIRHGEALAYRYDFDRDGLDDLVLENENLRLIVMPGAAGRAFALVDKKTGRNATDSVGALRDAFTKAPASYTWQGHDLRRSNWRWPELRLNNREASVKILQTTRTKAEAELQYQADDVFPGGALIRKKLMLSGGCSFVRIEYEITPKLGDSTQSFRTEVSTPVAGRNRVGAEILMPLASGISSYSFVPGRKLVPGKLSANWLAASDAEAGELFGLFWQSPLQAVIDTQQDSTLFKLDSPPLGKNESYRFSLGYYFGKNDPSVFERTYKVFRDAPQ